MAFQPSRQYLQRLAQIESGGDPNATTPYSTAKGLFQFTDPVAAEYNLTDPTDPVAATDAVKALTADNYAALSKSLGRAPTEAELYLAHQQGAQGAAKLLSNPDAPAIDILGKKQVLNNGGKASMKSSEFANLWQSKYNKTAPAIPDGTQIADSGQIASDAPMFGANDEPVSFGQGDEVVNHQEAPQLQNNKDTTPQMGGFRTAIDQFNQGTTAGYADEVIDPLAAFYAHMNGGGNFGDMYDQARKETKTDLDAEKSQHPYIAPAAKFIGMLTGAKNIGTLAKAVLPESALLASTKFAKSNPWTTAGAIGGGSAGLLASGEDQGDIGDRALAAASDFPAGVVGGLGGYGLLKNASGAINSAVGQKLLRNMNLDTTIKNSKIGGVLGDDIEGITNGAGTPPPPAAGAVGQLDPMKVAGVNDPVGFARMENGKYPVPLTKGDASQVGSVQRNEQRAYELGNQEIKDARTMQKQAIQKPFESILGDNQSMDPLALNGRMQDEATNAANVIRGKFDNLRAIEKSAWTLAGQGDAGIASSAIQKDFIEPVSNELADKGYVVGQVPQIDSKLKEITDIMKPDKNGEMSVTSVKLKALDNWYKSLNQAKFSSDAISDNTVDMHVGTMKRNFQGFLDKLQDTSIVNGDQDAIQAFKTARAASAKRFGFYDTDKAVQRILDTRELSGEQAVNTLWGATKISGKGSDGLLVPNIMGKLGDQAPQFQQALQRGFAAKILSDGLNAQSTAGKSVFDIAAGVNNSLKNLMKSRELFESVFPDKTTQDYFRNYSEGIGKIAQKEIGAINRSGTSMSVMGAFGALSKLLLHLSGANMMTGGMAISGANALLERRAASEIMGKAAKGLGDFDDQALANAFKQIDAKPVFYGGYVGGQSIDPIGTAIQGDTGNDGN